MPLTKIWGSLLAFLATAFLAGMFLLSLGSAGGFTDADRAAIGAVTEAGVAALKAEIESSPVQRAPTLLDAPEIREALERPLPEPGEPENIDERSIVTVFPEVAEHELLSDHPQMTVGIVDGNGKILIQSGIADQELTQAVDTTMFKSIPPGEEALFSSVLGQRLHVVKVSRAEEGGRRLVATQPLDTGAGSLLRRVLGTKNPAGLIREGELAGGIIGDLQIEPELQALATAHAEQTPEQGASKVFRVGEGLDARIGALGRVPGPAGQGPDGIMLAVLSRNTAAAGQQDLAAAIARASDRGYLARLNWPVLGSILVLGLALALYLPHFEGVTPMRRLAGELQNIAQGTQHQVFHEQYSGPPAQVAQAANAAQEAIHAAYMQEQAETEAEAEEQTQAQDEDSAAPRPRSRTGGRSRRGTRGHRRLTGVQQAAPSQSQPAGSPPSRAPAAIDLPSDDAEPEPPTLIHHGQQDTGAPTSASAPPPPPTSPAPPQADSAPPLMDAAPSEEDQAAAALAESLEGLGGEHPAGSAQPPPPPSSKPAASSSAPPAPTPPSPAERADPKEAYYREIYDEFVQVKMACGEPTEGFTFDKFANKLRKNTEQLRKRPEVKDVEFTVYVKDGKAALKAKVVKE